MCFLMAISFNRDQFTTFHIHSLVWWNIES
jgi:hypothetical protein